MGEEESHSGKSAGGALRFERLRRANLPVAPRGGALFRGIRFRRREKTDFRQVRPLDFAVSIKDPRDSELHVGLPGADPHVTEQHVGESLSLGTGDVDLVGTAGRNRPDLDGPLPIGIGDGGCGRDIGGATKGDGHHFTGYGPAPDRIRLIALEHHVIGENRRDEREDGVRQGRARGSLVRDERIGRGWRLGAR